MTFKSLAVSIFGFFMLSHSSAQDVPDLPEYQVIFDEFKYDATGYPESPGETNLFGENYWIDRTGNQQYQGFAWFYYNWRWQFRNGLIHPSGSIELDQSWPYSVKLLAAPGYTRNTSLRNEVPVQIESGFIFDKGTWVINTRLSDLETIRYFTHAFWIISPVATDPKNGDIRSWVEFNHEWQNWFSVNFAPGSNGSVDSLKDDIWARDNEWVKRKGYTGNVFKTERLPSLQKRTYLANGLRMYNIDSRSFSTGETAGGIALKNPIKNNASAFSCRRTLKGLVEDIEDPDICINALQKDLNGDVAPWVQLMIQYNGKDVVYSAFVSSPGKGFMHMESRATLNRNSLPLKVNLGIHTPNSSIVLDSSETSVMEIDWFYYSPKTDLSPEDVLSDVEMFRERSWYQVNLDAVSLLPPPAYPWQIEHLKTPDAEDNIWLVIPTLRETNGVEIHWNYRTRFKNDAFFSEWRGWENGDFFLEVNPQPYEIEMDVRVLDHHATDHRDRPFWANIPCKRFNYETRETSICTGGAQIGSPYSFDQRPPRLELEGSYPDPMRSQTTIKFGIPNSERVQILIFDALGRKVANVLDQFLGKGYHTITWVPDNLPAGTYFYHLVAGKETLTKSLVIIR